MTEHKFTDEEIIRALGCCLTVDVKGCGECPYRDESCINRIMTDALDLINRQKSLLELSEKGLKLSIKIFENWEKLYKIAKAEAVKEFAEYLKKYYRHIDKTAGALIEYTIDAKVKEFLEGNVCGANTETEK